MLKSCKWCGGIHPVGYECPARPKRQAQDTEAARVRNSSRWQRVRADVRQRDGGLCRWCLANGKIVRDDVQVHHILPLEKDPKRVKAFDRDWLICLCSRGYDSCHAKAERGEISPDRLHSLAIRLPEIL